MSDTARLMTLEDVLKKKKLRELKDIGFRLDVPLDTKRRTEDWRLADAEAIRCRMRTVRECLDYEQFNLFVNDHIRDREPDSSQSLCIDNDVMMQYDYLVDDFSSLGLAIQIHSKWYFVPEIYELANATKKEMKGLQATHRLFVRMEGCLVHFGMVEIHRMASLILPNVENGWSVLMHIYTRRMGLSGILNSGDKGYWLIYRGLNHPSRLFDLLNQKNMEHLPWAEFDPDDFIYTYHNQFPLDDEAYKRLRQWYETRDIDINTQDTCFIEAVNAAQNGCADEYYDILSVPFGDDVPELFIHAARELYAILPQWAYKGHSTRDIEQTLNPAVKKVPMGDLCPCGSGRRYRNCCGRLQ